MIPAGAHVVSFFCNPATNTLTRHVRTLTSAWARPASCAAMVAGAATAVLAGGVGTCSLSYDPPGASTGLSRFGLVSISLALTEAGESVNLYHQVHVDNTP